MIMVNMPAYIAHQAGRVGTQTAFFLKLSHSAHVCDPQSS